MDILKFIILSVACTGGFIVSLYPQVANEKGWPVGKLFWPHKISYIQVLGYLCLYGSIILSFIYNPWWSSILVIIIGFICFYIIAFIFKTYSQLISGILVFASLIFIPLFVFKSPARRSIVCWTWCADRLRRNLL